MVTSTRGSSQRQSKIEKMSNESFYRQIANVNILEGIRFYVSFAVVSLR